MIIRLMGPGKVKDKTDWVMETTKLPEGKVDKICLIRLFVKIKIRNITKDVDTGVRGAD